MYETSFYNKPEGLPKENSTDYDPGGYYCIQCNRNNWF